MRILVVGAGAVGGYFGGRLLEARRDVTFLVRPKRAKQLSDNGLTIQSMFGNVTLPPPPTIEAAQLREPFDIVLLSCKAYHLDSAITAMAPAVGPQTAVVPLLNGMRHLDALDARFGAPQILGGRCIISARLEDNRIVHLNDLHQIAFGERFNSQAALVASVATGLIGTPFEARKSDHIILDMWEKWVFLASLAGINCLMRASVGDIVAAGGSDLACALLDECRAIATAAGWPPRATFLQTARGRLTEAGSPLVASMLADLQQGGPTEADHILGDLLQRSGPVGDQRSLLRIAYVASKAHEARIANAPCPYFAM